MNAFNRNVDKAMGGDVDGGTLSPNSNNGRDSSKIKSDMALLMDHVGWDAQVMSLLEQNQDP